MLLLEVIIQALAVGQYWIQGHYSQSQNELSLGCAILVSVALNTNKERAMAAWKGGGVATCKRLW